MEQLGLHLAHRLSYSSNNFHLHAGIKESIESAIAGMSTDVFSLSYIQGAPRFGKTHASIYLSDILISKKYLPRIIEGDEFHDWLITQSSRITFTPFDRIIVDDADKYLLHIQPGSSGPFVNFIETLRRMRSSIVLFSSASIQSLPCDNHVMSRLAPGEGIHISAPDECDMEILIRHMAEQRGIKLKERKIEFLVRRLRRDIPSIEDYFERVSHLSRILGQRIRFPLLGDAIERKLT